MKNSGTRFRVAWIAVGAALLLGLGLAAPAAAGIIGAGSGRIGGSLSAVVALCGAVIGATAMARSARGVGNGGRNGAVVAVAAGLIGSALAGLHLATNTGPIGSGSGRAGAIVALALGLIGTLLGGLTLARSRRTAS